MPGSDRRPRHSHRGRDVLHGFIGDGMDGGWFVASSALDIGEPEPTESVWRTEASAISRDILEGLRRAEHLPAPQPEW